MKKPTLHIGKDFCGLISNQIKVHCDKKRFNAIYKDEEIDVPVEKLQTDTDNPQINLIIGLAWIIDRKT